jgi:hypothetical protein
MNSPEMVKRAKRPAAIAEPAMIPVRLPDEGVVEGGELRLVGKAVAIFYREVNIYAAKLDGGHILTVVAWPSMVVTIEDVMVVSDTVESAEEVGVWDNVVDADGSLLEDDAEVEDEVGETVVDEVVEELAVDDDAGLIDDEEVDDGIVEEPDGVRALELLADLQQYRVQTGSKENQRQCH